MTGERVTREMLKAAVRAFIRHGGQCRLTRMHELTRRYREGLRAPVPKGAWTT